MSNSSHVILGVEIWIEHFLMLAQEVDNDDDDEREKIFSTRRELFEAKLKIFWTTIKRFDSKVKFGNEIAKSILSTLVLTPIQYIVCPILW